MKRTIWQVLVLLLVVSMLGACAPRAAAPAPAAQAPADTSKELYIFVSAMGNLEYFNALKYGWAWAGKALGVQAEYVGPAEIDANAEAVALDQAIARKPAGIAVFAWDPVLTPGINKAIEAGIPVVTICGDAPDSKRIAFVGSSHEQLGFIGGTHVAEALGGKGKVAILSLPGTQMFDDREKGFRNAFKLYPGIEVVQVGDTKADIAVAVSTAKAILQAHPDLAAFVGTDSTAGMGAATAVKEAGLVGKVLTVAMDRNSDVLQAIKEGTLTGSVAQDDAAMSFWGLQVLYNYNHNQAPLTTDNKAAKASTGPFNLLMNANYIDKTNLQYYLDANKLYAP
ncbi:MAG: substrate-binding domain-containing protein [Anaerolineae bacterium]